MSSLTFIISSNQCEKCIGLYVNCKPCLINNLKRNFINWTSENAKIDNFIQERQLKFDDYRRSIFEWIPYNQFSDIKEVGENGFATAIWKDGPLRYNYDKKEYVREPDLKVGLKCSYNSQNIIDE